MLYVLIGIHNSKVVMCITCFILLCSIIKFVPSLDSDSPNRFSVMVVLLGIVLFLRRKDYKNLLLECLTLL